jgi:hypothetical protein
VRDRRRNALKDVKSLQRHRMKKLSTSTMPRAAVRFERASFEAERYMVKAG